MYIDNRITEKLRKNDSRISRLNNMLASPLQNNMTEEKEEMIKAELEFLYKSQTKIYKDLSKQLSEKYDV